MEAPTAYAEAVVYTELSLCAHSHERRVYSATVFSNISRWMFCKANVRGLAELRHARSLLTFVRGLS